MSRVLLYRLAWVLPMLWSMGGNAQDAPPPESAPNQGVVFELLINGESFLVEENRVVKVRSEKNPETEYQVAIRVAPTQKYRMPTLLFAYDRPAIIECDTEGGQNVVRLIHELGFTMLIHDLGGTLDDDARKQALGILVESVVASFKEMKARNIQVGNTHARKFGENTGLGAMIRYIGAQNLGHACLVYVLAGKDFSATCVVQYLDGDQDDVLPLVRKTLDSFQAAP